MKVSLFRIILAAMLLAALTLTGGCSDKRDNAEADASDPAVLVVMAGSELKDMEPFLDQIKQATGVRLKFKYTGTLDVIDRIGGGEVADAVWVSHGKYLALNAGFKAKIKASEKTMLSPVVLGIKAQKARELGWDKKEPTWKEIAEAAGAGKFTFGMTNPVSSNSGFSAAVGLAAALAANPDALTEADAKNPALAQFFRAQKLTAGSSGWLADAYIREQDRLDGLINYESVLLSLNAGSKLKEPLVLVYPKEGIVTADYPLMLLNDAKRESYTKLVAFLKNKEFQTALSQATLRRPVNPDAKPAAAIPQKLLIEISFPGSPSVVDAVLDSFLNDVRVPALSTFVLDVSGSMGGDRIDKLKAAVLGLAGDDPSLTGRFARFRNRETVNLLTFSSVVHSFTTYELGSDEANKQAVISNLRTEVTGLAPRDGTALYDAIKTALERTAAANQGANAGHYTTVVVMTDGASNEGMDSAGFAQWYSSAPPAIQTIKVFPILFGEGRKEELQQVANLTGGRVFDSKGNLRAVFKEIRGYQ